MAHYIDLNCDLGESFGPYVLGNDEEVLKEITSANIACGYHAGDYRVMAQTVKQVAVAGVAAGAHPGFQDLQGFGRREIQISPEEVYQLTVYQVSALQGFCRIEGTAMQHVKPHGALYNMAGRDPGLAEAIASAVYDVDKRLILFGLSGSELVKAGERQGLRVAKEGFADRTYQPDGSLTPRGRDNAVIHDADTAVRHVKQMILDGTCTAVDGTIIPLEVNTLCVHGDNPQTLAFTRSLRHMLLEEGIQIRSFT
ncbi:LamB/YcsF family protein [Sinobaca sp. H24]|uniref:LamB/YcsF family protein n=1 Tax=Sinobaca sp. H24 TaxID=2923376 RepID=UPI0020798ACC|nr:5-oxoprolinase subunit PxpA [Sinobaca sp. H24]